MTIYALGEILPRIHETAFVHPDATVIGDVTIGAHSSIWPGAVLRGDLNSITIGDRTSIQDGTVIHVSHNHETQVGNDCVIAHLVHLEGCVIGDRCLIGVGALVRHGTHVGDEAIVGAHAMVRDGIDVPSRHRALGLPAVVSEGNVDVDDILRIAQIYVDNAERYRKELKIVS
jgi:carbonic anhydrase/acetyltransferase-like protein (isoleucine patch superfamily)